MAKSIVAAAGGELFERSLELAPRELDGVEVGGRCPRGLFLQLFLQQPFHHSVNVDACRVQEWNAPIYASQDKGQLRTG